MKRTCWMLLLQYPEREVVSHPVTRFRAFQSAKEQNGIGRLLLTAGKMKEKN